MLHSKNKVFSYWRARYLVEPYGKNLQSLLHGAFDKTKVRARRYQPLDGSPYYQFINAKQDRNGFFCASFIAYEQGRIGHIIEERLDQDEIAPEALPLQKATDGTQRQYVDGKLFLVCFKNHLIIAQDQQLKGKHLEIYLNEMIHKRVEAFPKEQAIILERALSQVTKKKIKGVKAVHLSASLEYETHKQRYTGKPDKSITVPKGAAWDAITAFVQRTVDLAPYSTDGFIDPKEIDVSLSLRWRKKSTERVSDQLDSFANTFRHVDDEIDFELETTSGGKISRDELRLRIPKSVSHQDDMPVLTDIFSKMETWYHELNQKGDI